MEGIVTIGGTEGTGTSEYDVTATGKCTVGWLLGICGSGGDGTRVGVKRMFSDRLFEDIDVELAVWQLNQKNIFCVE